MYCDFVSSYHLLITEKNCHKVESIFTDDDKNRETVCATNSDAFRFSNSDIYVRLDVCTPTISLQQSNIMLITFE